MVVNIGNYIMKPTFGLLKTRDYNGYAVNTFTLLAGYYQIIEVSENHIKAKFLGTGRNIVKGKKSILYFGDLMTEYPGLKIEFI